jgi:MoxR-like ATPase
VREIRDLLTTGLVERDVAVRLALLAALSGEHLLLVGPPGTAKSFVARRLRLAFADASYFERLLTRFSVPEELFGPLSIKGLEEDRYERLTTSYLPSASIAFLDEIFKANSAILNALLTLLNEREFDNGDRREKTPLTAVVGAGNELPEGEELDALFDRFLLRLHVGPVSKDAFPELLKLRDGAEPVLPEALRLTGDDLASVREAAGDVRVPDDVQALLCDLRDWCTPEEIPVSDRRWRKVVKLLQTSALTNGRDAVSIWDCWLLQHCLWSNAADREKVYDWYASRVGAKRKESSHLVRIVNSWESRLDRDRKVQSQMCDPEGNLLYVRENGEFTPDKAGQARRDGEALFVAPDKARTNRQRTVNKTNDGKGYTEEELAKMIVHTNQGNSYFEEWRDRKAYLENTNNWLVTEWEPAIGPTKHKSAHIESCLRDLRRLRTEMESHKHGIERQVESFEEDIRSHLWVTVDFAEPASRGLQEASDEVERLLTRLARVTKGFELLPREEEYPPAP